MVKKINVDSIWSGVKKQKEKTFARLKKRYLKLQAQLEKLYKEKNKLEKSGVEFGTLSWKTQVTRSDGTRKKYLRILYPSGKRKYIGRREDKIQKAMEAIKRGERVKLLEFEISKTESEIKNLIRDIRDI